MMRLSEGIVFFALATGIHAGIWHIVPVSNGASASGGTGADAMTLAAATPAQAAMVARWQQKPAVSNLAPDTLRPSLTQAVLLRTPTVPDLTRPSPLPAPRMPQLAAYPSDSRLPQVDTTPAAPPQVNERPPKVRPKARPTALKAQAAAPAQAERRASGQAQRAQRGTSGKDLTQSENAKRSNALRAKWGAQIHAKVQRNMRYPRGATGTGTAKLALKVTPAGKLETLNVLHSSGNAILDKAAIHAVRRAGRFAKAPQELKDAAYTFSLSLTFTQ